MPNRENKTRISCFVAALPLAVLTGILFSSPVVRSETGSSGAAVEVVEVASGSEYPLRANVTTEVDMESRLVVRFTPLELPGGVVVSDWKRLSEILVSVDSLERRILAVQAKRVDLSDSLSVVTFQNELDELNLAITLFTIEALPAAVGLDPDSPEFITFLEEVNGNAGPGKGMLALGRWLRKEIVRLQNDLRFYIYTRDQVFVQVHATHDPFLGSRRAVHVSAYDNIPLGRLQPINRTGLNLNDTERQRLANELAGNREIVAAAREITTAGSKLGPILRERLDTLTQRLESLSGALAGLSGSTAPLDSLSSRLAGLNVAPATALNNELDTLREHVNTLIKIDDCLRETLQRLREAESLDLVDALAGANGLLTGVDNCIRRFTRALSALSNVDAVLSRIGSQMTALADTASSRLWSDLQQRYVRLAQDVTQAFPHTGRVIMMLSAALKSGADGATVSAELNAAAADRFSHELINAPEGSIDLRRAGWAHGDELEVKVLFLRAPTDDQPLRELTYTAKAELFGARRTIDGMTIFYRGRASDATTKKWNVNVAAVMSWSYHYRKPQSWRSRGFNMLQPSVGIHLASLNQGDDAVEYGLGFNAVLGEGVVAGGLGWNLSENERKYWMLGSNLLSVIEKVF